jgi:hypothetical protein
MSCVRDSDHRPAMTGLRKCVVNVTCSCRAFSDCPVRLLLAPGYRMALLAGLSKVSAQHYVQHRAKAWTMAAGSALVRCTLQLQSQLGLGLEAR